MDYLHSDLDEEKQTVKTVRVNDTGSTPPQCAKVLVQGVPAYGIIDSTADITIMGSDLFKKVASVDSRNEISNLQTPPLARMIKNSLRCTVNRS